jgi:hypothetical protein
MMQTMMIVLFALGVAHFLSSYFTATNERAAAQLVSRDPQQMPPRLRDQPDKRPTVLALAHVSFV